jgi:hypothetical protein
LVWAPERRGGVPCVDVSIEAIVRLGLVLNGAM